MGPFHVVLKIIFDAEHFAALRASVLGRVFVVVFSHDVVFQTGLVFQLSTADVTNHFSLGAGRMKVLDMHGKSRLLSKSSLTYVATEGLQLHVSTFHVASQGAGRSLPLPANLKQVAGQATPSIFSVSFLILLLHKISKLIGDEIFSCEILHAIPIVSYTGGHQP